MLQRLRKTLEQPAQAPGPALLPESVLLTALGANPLVLGMRLSVHSVRDATLQLHSLLETAPLPPPWLGRRSGSVTCGACAECGCPNMLNARSGEIACSSCGVVCTTQSINVQQEYTAPAPASRAPTSAAGVRGVPAALVAALQAPVVADEAFARSRHWHELDHWNAYTRLSYDQLERADGHLRRWEASNTSRRDALSSTRIAAVLLYPLLLPSIRSDEQTRRHIHDNLVATRLQGAPSQPFPSAQTTPDAVHACTMCGRACHTAKDARFHCRSGFGKRKRGV